MRADAASAGSILRPLVGGQRCELGLFDLLFRRAEGQAQDGDATQERDAGPVQRPLVLDQPAQREGKIISMGASLTVLISVAFVLFGAACLFWPRAIQEWALKRQDERRQRLKHGLLVDPLLGRPQYLWQLRLFGLLFVLGGVVLASAILLNH